MSTVGGGLPPAAGGGSVSTGRINSNNSSAAAAATKQTVTEDRTAEDQLACPKDILLQNENVQVWRIRVPVSTSTSSVKNSNATACAATVSILVAIFLCSKISKAMLQEFNSILHGNNRVVSGLYLDISNVSSFFPDVLSYNVEMIAQLSDQETSIKRVGLVGSTLVKKSLDVLMVMKRPKVPTKAFSKDEEAWKYVFECCSL